MMEIDFWKSFNSINQKLVPKFTIYILGKEFTMPITIAEMMSRKISHILEEDESMSAFCLCISKEEIFTMSSFNDDDFKQIVWNSFDKFLKLFKGESSDLSLKEAECIEKFMCILETEFVTIDKSKFDEITLENSLEIMNAIGGEKASDFIAMHIKELDVNLLGKDRFIEVLESKSFSITEDELLDIIISYINRNRDYNLLQRVNPAFLSELGRKKYSRFISENFDHIGFSHDLCNTLLLCIESSKGERNINKYFRKKNKQITVSCSKVGSGHLLGILFPQKSIFSTTDQEGSWVMWEFPENIIISRYVFYPLGDANNPLGWKLECFDSNGNWVIVDKQENLHKFAKSYYTPEVFITNRLRTPTKKVKLTMTQKNALQHNNLQFSCIEFIGIVD